jgi:hypothetical protein
VTSIREMVRRDPRRAGAVRRYHTWPTLQTQTVAEASWNVTRILLQIWPDAPPKAITHALMNDCGEIKTGDLPFPVKRDNSALKDIITGLEWESFREQGIRHLAEPEGLASLWTQRVKVCDMLEMWEFGLEEMALGSVYATPIVEDTLNDIARLIQVYRMSDDDLKRIEEYTECRRALTPARA